MARSIVTFADAENLARREQKCNHLYCLHNNHYIHCSNNLPKIFDLRPTPGSCWKRILEYDEIMEGTRSPLEKYFDYYTKYEEGICVGCIKLHKRCSMPFDYVQASFVGRRRFFALEFIYKNLKKTAKDRDILYFLGNVDAKDVLRCPSLFRGRTFPTPPDTTILFSSPFRVLTFSDYRKKFSFEELRNIANLVKNEDEVMLYAYNKIIDERVESITRRMVREVEDSNFLLHKYLPLEDILRCDVYLLDIFCRIIPNSRAYRPLLVLKSIQWDEGLYPLSMGLRISARLRDVIFNEMHQSKNKRLRFKKKERARLRKLGIPKKDFQWLELAFHEE